MSLKKFNFKFRPKSYWAPMEVSKFYESKIKGEIRKKMAIKALKKKETIPQIILKDSLPENVKNYSEAQHPWMMGGEYLPNLENDEIEIARVILKSTTLDIISINAKKEKNRISYFIADEYGDKEWNVTPSKTIKPLSFKQLINMINFADEHGLIDTFRRQNYIDGDTSPEDIYDFATASSAFYPDLERYYDLQNNMWLKKEKKRLKKEEKKLEKEEKRLEKIKEKQDKKLKPFRDYAKKSLFQVARGRYGAGALDFQNKISGITQFVKNYFKKYKKLPEDKHYIKDMNLEVIFPKKLKENKNILSFKEAFSKKNK